MINRRHGWTESFKPLFLGFTLSIALTIAAYRIATKYHLTDTALMTTLFILVAVQALIQFVFFLHLGMESKPHWNVISFLFTVIVIVIVIGGTIWIMKNLSYNIMPTEKELR